MEVVAKSVSVLFRSGRQILIKSVFEWFHWNYLVSYETRKPIVVVCGLYVLFTKAQRVHLAPVSLAVVWINAAHADGFFDGKIEWSAWSNLSCQKSLIFPTEICSNEQLKNTEPNLDQFVMVVLSHNAPDLLVAVCPASPPTISCFIISRDCFFFLVLGYSHNLSRTNNHYN